MEDPQSNTSTLSRKDRGAGAGLDEESLLEMYRQMVLCRTLDERVWALNRQGKAAIVASAQGQEAAQIGSVWALRPGEDQFYIYYRDLAVLLTLGMTPKEIMLGYLAKAGEPMSGARQFPTHGAYPKYGIYNLSNVVATNLPQAVGAALASKMRKEHSVTIVYFGDGASSAGDTHEAMNFASIHKLPVIFFCENNRYAISVPLSKQMAVDSVASRAQGYGMPGLTVDGCDIAAVYEATSAAAHRAREGLGPTLIEAMVERYLPHTSDDDDLRYRTAEDIEEARKRDPVRILKEQLSKMGALTPEKDAELREAAKRQVNEATDFADEAPYPGTESFYDHVYAPDDRPAGGGPSP
jgi:2-oxoisovalerate dehydrogenase E1 component alpha subunit